MPKLLISLVRTLAFALPLTASLPGQAQEQGLSPLAEMGGQLAAFSGQMHAAAKVCGGYTAEQLAEMKRQQREQLSEQGFSAAAFDKAFADGERKGAERWKSLSSAEQEAACADMKQPFSATED